MLTLLALSRCAMILAFNSMRTQVNSLQRAVLPGTGYLGSMVWSKFKNSKFSTIRLATLELPTNMASFRVTALYWWLSLVYIVCLDKDSFRVAFLSLYLMLLNTFFSY